jgi:predicted TIM-barrel fold metal-dependent hydrolase
MDAITVGQERGPIADALRRLYWDTASASSDPVLHLLRSVTSVHYVVFGTDYPYRNEISIGGLRQLQQTADFEDGERRAILGETAARLFRASRALPRIVEVVVTR